MGIKSIEFTKDMNLAILANNKDMTRRLIKSSTGNCPKIYSISAIFREPLGAMYVGGIIRPKYQTGDILWIRETWRIGAWNEENQSIAVDYKDDDFCRLDWIRIKDKSQFDRYVRQTVDQAKKAGIRRQPDGSFEWVPGYSPARWRSQCTMPMEVARTFLQVTDVIAQRIQEITNEDIIREGIAPGDDARNRFIKLWDRVYSQNGNWSENHYVWAYTFKRIQRPENWPEIRR
jgi:hypothetical protein